MKGKLEFQKNNLAVLSVAVALFANLGSLAHSIVRSQANHWIRVFYLSFWSLTLKGKSRTPGSASRGMSLLGIKSHEPDSERLVCKPGSRFMIVEER